MHIDHRGEGEFAWRGPPVLVAGICQALRLLRRGRLFFGVQRQPQVFTPVVEQDLALYPGGWDEASLPDIQRLDHELVVFAEVSVGLDHADADLCICGCSLLQWQDHTGCRKQDGQEGNAHSLYSGLFLVSGSNIAPLPPNIN